MNKRIDELMIEAGARFEFLHGVHYDDFQYKKFAELIVKECVDRVTSQANGWGDMTGFAIKESILDCAKDLKEHFGVEE